MKFQKKPGWCGPAAIANALRVLGHRVPQERIAKYAGTTIKDGTSEHGLKQALDRLGYGWSDLSERRYAAAEAALMLHLHYGPAILLTETGNHWETALGMGPSGRIIIFDPQNLKFNTSENGLHVVSQGRQMRWYWTEWATRRYALLVNPK